MGTFSRRLIILFEFLFISLSYEAIFSSYKHEARLQSHPKEVPLWSGSVGEVSAPLNRFRRYLMSRRRRNAEYVVEDPRVSNSLRTSWIDLGNDTSHNQALIHWSGSNSKVIFILTRKKSPTPSGTITSSDLYRSVDYGANYNVEADKFDSSTTLKGYFVCPTNKNKVIFIDAYLDSTRIWISKDQGESYRQQSLNFSIDKIEFHPLEQDWILGYDKEEATLYASMDLGSTWSKMQEDVTADRYSWYVKNVDNGTDATRTVHMEYRDMSFFPHRAYFVKSCLAPHCDPSPFQVHCDELGNIDMESLVVQDNYVFAQKSGPRQKFYVSYNRGPFKKAKFTENGEQTDIHVVSSDWSTVVLGVNHQHGSTHLYFSDAQGVNFALSLSNARYFERKSGEKSIFNVDIHEVKGVRGAFLVNRVNGLSGLNQTYLTWDNGRTWTTLAAPAGDSSCVRTKSDCLLNLHCAMVQTRSGYYMPSMESKDTIPGLLLAHGSVGTSLVDLPSRVNVYMSRDAGLTWRKALTGRHLYIVGDHGAMIVAVKMLFHEPVDRVWFSSTFGRSWTQHKFTNSSPVHPDGLLTEPGEHTHHFTLFAHKNYHDNWKLFAMDFSSIVTRNCTYPADFSNWTMPPSSSPSKCHLGMVDTVERVDAHDCLIGESYKLKKSKTICNCTDDDYECGPGYVAMSGGKCQTQAPTIDWVEDVIDPDEVEEEEPCVRGMRRVPTSHRRIPGDQCAHDVPNKLFTMERCGPYVYIQLLNETTEARLGQGLLISVQGSSDVDWEVKRRSEPRFNGSVLPQKNNDTVAVTSLFPGDYEVRAVRRDDPDIYDNIVVSFWYPIDRVTVVHPPVVGVNRPYNATALVSSRRGLPPTSWGFGKISYTWTGDAKGDKDSISVSHSVVSSYRLTVFASNSISRGRAHGRVVVKPYVETLVLPLVTSPKLNRSSLSPDWLSDVSDILAAKMYQVPDLQSILVSNKLVNNHNFHVFIPPSVPVEAQLLFSPGDHGTPSSDHLKQLTVQMAKVFASTSILLHLPYDHVITIGKIHIVDDAGEVQYLGSLSGGMVALIVIATLILFTLVLALVARKYARNTRFGRYFVMTTPANLSFQGSRIVRSRPNDCDPIVDEEEFIDDDLDNMEAIASPQDGTLQFRG